MNAREIEITREQLVAKLRDAYDKVQTAVDSANDEISSVFSEVKSAVDEYNAVVNEAKNFVDGIDEEVFEVSTFQPDDVELDEPQINDLDDECMAALELEELDIEELDLEDDE